MKYIMRRFQQQHKSLHPRGAVVPSGYNASLGYTNELDKWKERIMKDIHDIGINADINKWSELPWKFPEQYPTDYNNAGLSTAAKARPDIKAYNDDGSCIYIHISIPTYSLCQNPIIEMEEIPRERGPQMCLTGNLEFRISIELNLITQYTYLKPERERYAYQSSRTQAGSGYWGDQKATGRKHT